MIEDALQYRFFVRMFINILFFSLYILIHRSIVEF